MIWKWREQRSCERKREIERTAFWRNEERGGESNGNDERRRVMRGKTGEEKTERCFEGRKGKASRSPLGAGRGGRIYQGAADEPLLLALHCA